MKPAMPTSSSVRVDVDAQLMQAEGHVDQFPRDLLDCGAAYTVVAILSALLQLHDHEPARMRLVSVSASPQ